MKLVGFSSFSTASLEVVVFSLCISVCLSSPVENDKLKGKTKRSTASSSSRRKCMMTCLEGEPSQICFDESVHDARPGPVLPDHVCNAIGCLKSAEPCPTFPFRCMIEKHAVLEQSDVEGITAMCNVPVKEMEPCSFSPPSGSSNDFRHGQEVRFVTRPRKSTALKSKTCICYDGKWIWRKAVYGTKSVNENDIFCDVGSSKNLEYLRVKKVKKPRFSKNSVFLRKFFETFDAFTN